MESDYYDYTKKCFDRWAHIYDFASFFLSGVRHRVVKFSNPGVDAKILDVATGTGKQAFAFGKKGYHVIGIDISEGMLAIAEKKNKYPGVRFELGDATNMKFKDATFDMACVSFALHDMPREIRAKVLNEMRRVVAPSGKIVIVDYALPRNKVGKWLVYNLVRSYESRYYTDFIHSDLEKLIEASGIELEQTQPVLGGVGMMYKGARPGMESFI